MERRRSLLRTNVVIACVCLLACMANPRRTGDVDEMKSAGELRIAVRPGFFEAPGNRDGSSEDVALLRQFGARLGVNLRWVEAARHDQLFEMIRNGSADIAVGRFSQSALLDSGLRATVAIDWVEDLLIGSPNLPHAEAGTLSGLRAHLHRSALTPAVQSFLSENGISIETVPEELSIEMLLERVRSGRYQLTVVDSQIANSLRAATKMKVLGTVVERRPIGWAVRESSSQLRIAIEQFLFAERVLSRATPTTTCRDRQRIRQAGVLRLVTRNSPTTCAVEQGGLRGFEYDLALGFARQLGVRLELSIPPPGVEPLTWLEEGFGDFAALHEPIAWQDSGAFLTTIPYRRVDLVGVVSGKTDPPASVDDLAGVRAAASRSVASLANLMPLLAPIRVTPPNPGGDAFSAMLEVARGNVPVAVVDRDAATLELSNRPDLQMGPVVVPKVDLVWVLNTSSSRLLSSANRYLREARSSGDVRQLVLNEFGSWKPHRLKTLLPTPDDALSPYDELLQWAGRTYDIDWRLLGSLMYEESRFDPDAVGPGGSAGLFQFMPFTWRELGVEDPHHPQEAAEAAGRYLRQLMDGFADLELPDQVAMAIASYNVGPRHLFDARRLAAEMNLDPNRWLGSVETAMLLIDDQEVARRFPAGVCRCRRAVGYTRRILRRYAAYTEQFPPA